MTVNGLGTTRTSAFTPVFSTGRAFALASDYDTQRKLREELATALEERDSATTIAMSATENLAAARVRADRVHEELAALRSNESRRVHDLTCLQKQLATSQNSLELLTRNGIVLKEELRETKEQLSEAQLSREAITLVARASTLHWSTTAARATQEAEAVTCELTSAYTRTDTMTQKLADIEGWYATSGHELDSLKRQYHIEVEQQRRTIMELQDTQRSSESFEHQHEIEIQQLRTALREVHGADEIEILPVDGEITATQNLKEACLNVDTTLNTPRCVAEGNEEQLQATIPQETQPLRACLEKLPPFRRRIRSVPGRKATRERFSRSPGLQTRCKQWAAERKHQKEISPSVQRRADERTHPEEETTMLRVSDERAKPNREQQVAVDIYQQERGAAQAELLEIARVEDLERTNSELRHRLDAVQDECECLRAQSAVWTERHKVSIGEAAETEQCLRRRLKDLLGGCQQINEEKNLVLNRHATAAAQIAVLKERLIKKKKAVASDCKHGAGAAEKSAQALHQSSQEVQQLKAALAVAEDAQASAVQECEIRVAAVHGEYAAELVLMRQVAEHHLQLSAENRVLTAQIEHFVHEQQQIAHFSMLSTWRWH